MGYCICSINNEILLTEINDVIKMLRFMKYVVNVDLDFIQIEKVKNK